MGSGGYNRSHGAWNGSHLAFDFHGLLAHVICDNWVPRSIVHSNLTYRPCLHCLCTLQLVVFSCYSHRGKTESEIQVEFKKIKLCEWSCLARSVSFAEKEA